MVTSQSQTLSLIYLGGIPKHDKPEPAEIALFETHAEIRTRHWGWSIGLDAIELVGEPLPAPDGEGLAIGIVWSPPGEEQRTLTFSGRDAGRLRFLLAQSVARAQFAAAMAAAALEEPLDVARAPGQPRALTPWQRELRRMRALTTAGMTVALAALLVVFGVAIFVVGGSDRSRWAADRVTIDQRQAELRTAETQGEETAISAALQALQDACSRLTTYNGEAGNQGDSFTAVQQVCATVGVSLY